MDKYKKMVEKDKDIDIKDLPPPRYHLHSGSYALNKLMSRSLSGALPQGRLVAFGGHSSSGKSLIGASAVAQTLNEGGAAFIVDTEGALDNDYLAACGVPLEKYETGDLARFPTSSISACTKAVNRMIRMYKEEEVTQKLVILVDSLDMMFTDSEQNQIDSDGNIGGDQGQRAKQLKKMLASWTNSISDLNITIICTKQVYVNQEDKYNPWVFTESLKYVFSSIVIFEKLVYREKDGDREHLGFVMKASTYKSRGAREKQTVRVEVPFDHGLDPYAGILEIAQEWGVIEIKGAWINFDGEKRNGKKKAEADKEFMQSILDKLLEMDSEERSVNADLSDYIAESEKPEKEESATSRRKKKAKAMSEEDED